MKTGEIQVAMILGGQNYEGKTPKPSWAMTSKHCAGVLPFEIGVRYGGKSSENTRPGKAQVIFAPNSPWNVRNL